MKGPGIVLVLGGGGAKAAAHIGAYQALEEAGLVPSRIIGTSMGAVIGALFAGGCDARDALARITSVGAREFVKSHPLAFLRGVWARALLRPEPFRAALARILPVARFEDLRIPLTVTATDLDTSELVRYGEGGTTPPLADALYASCALSVFFPPARVDGRRLADGGLRTVLPIELAAEAPARLVIAVDAGPGFEEGSPVEAELPPLIAAHNASTGILMAEQTRLARALWDATPGRPPLVYIRPRVPAGGTFRTDLIRRFVEEGYAAARMALAGLPSGGG